MKVKCDKTHVKFQRGDVSMAVNHRMRFSCSQMILKMKIPPQKCQKRFSEEDFQRLDDEAKAKELRRLVEMKVLRETDVS